MSVMERILSDPRSVYAFAKREVNSAVGRMLFALPEGKGRQWGRRKKKKYGCFVLLKNERLFANCNTIASFADQVLFQANSPIYSTERLVGHADHFLEGDVYALNDYRSVKDPSGTIEWHRDYETGYRYKVTHFSKARSANKVDDGTDIKRIWEVARMQYLLAPAYLYWLTGEEKYAAAVIGCMDSFITEVPYDCGPLWQPSMEVGIRLANMVLAFSLVSGWIHRDELFCKRFKLSVAQHYAHIVENPENLGGMSSNHHLGALLGMSAFCAIMQSESLEPIISDLTSALECEIGKQLLPDGFDYEGSSSYQRLVAELLCTTIMFAKCCDAEIPESITSKVAKSADVARRMALFGGGLLQIGDNDSGRAVQIVPSSREDFRALVSTAERMCLEPIVRPRQLNKCVEVIGDGIVLAEAGGVSFALAGFDGMKYGMGGHCHNDLLSFSFSVDGVPFVVDPGTGSYTGNPDLRNELRSVASHSAVSIDGFEQRQLSAGRLFGWEGCSGNTCVSGEADGSAVCLNGRTTCYESRTGCVHERRVTIDAGSKTIEVKDRVTGSFSELKMRIPLHPKVKVSRENSRITLKCGSIEVVVHGTWDLSIETMPYSPSYDVVNETNCLSAISVHPINSISFTVIRKRVGAGHSYCCTE